MSGSLKYMVAFLLVASWYTISAQNLNPQYNFKQLNVQNGLAQNIVYHFLQDSKGYIWLGTRNGLTMYDGVSTVNFLHDERKNNSLASNFITRILEDSAHQLWIGNEKGIDLFNRSSNTFYHFGVDRPDGTKDNTFCVPMAFVSATELWFIDTKTKSIRSFNTKTKSSGFVCSTDAVDGTIYINPLTGIIHYWSYLSNGTIHLVFKEHKLIQKQTFFTGHEDAFINPHFEVVHVLQQNDTIAWLSANKGLISLNPVTNTFKMYNVWKGRPVEELRFAALSSNGTLWLGSGPSGVYTFDVESRQFLSNFSYDKSSPFSICSNNIVSLYLDRSGNIWCGSYGNGASYASIENNFFSKHLVNAKESNSNITWMGLDNDENCWCIVNDQNGFWVFDSTLTNSKIRVPLEQDGETFNSSIYKLLFDDDGENIWCCGSKGLYLFNKITNHIQQVKYTVLSKAFFGSNSLRDIIKLRDGSIIFSTYSGLYKLKKENGKPVISLYSQLNQLQDNSFGKLFQDEAGYIYIKGNDSLFILKEVSVNQQPTLVKAIAFPIDIYQYFNDTIQNLIYLATSNGSYILDRRYFNIKQQITDPQIPFSSVSSMFEKDKKLWLFGEKGLYYFDKQNKQGRTFTIEDGLPANEFNVSAFAISKDGKCIAGSTNGLVSFYPDRLQKNLYPPHAQLAHIYVNDILYQGSSNTNETNNIRLAYQQNTFAFDFGAITFQHNNDCSYEYKLEKYDEEWIKSGTTRYTRYSKISPGDYNFHLRVYDVNGILSPFTKTLGIKISKAFWQTNIFKIAVLLIVLFIGRFAVKWYLAGKIRKQKIIFDKQQAVEQERTRIAMEMHDDLGSGLTAIRYLAGSLSVQSSDATKNTADKIASSAKSLVDSMNDIIWTMKSDNNSLEEVLAYIKKQAAEQLETANINYRFDFPANIPTIKLNSEQKRNLLLIAKEAIHNIIKHSNSNDVLITAEIDNNHLQLKIKDNGKGFDSRGITQFGNGIKNMHRRAEAMKAQLNILNGEGTEINVTLTFG